METFTNMAQIEKRFFPDKFKLRGLKLIKGYNTICPDCKGKMPDRYYGEPKIMRCPECEGKHMAKRSMKIVKRALKREFPKGI